MKTAAKFARPDSQTLQGRDNSKIATPSARISKTISMRRKFSDQRQMRSFSTVSAVSSHSLQARKADYSFAKAVVQSSPLMAGTLDSGRGTR